VARKRAKAKKNKRKSLVKFSKRSADIMLRHMRSGGYLPRFDPLTGRKLTGHETTALINEFMRPR